MTKTTFDTILKGTLSFEQPHNGYRFGVDAILLAASLNAHDGNHALDMGCGVGAVMISAAHRLPGLTVTGVDIQPDLIDLANRNAIMNNVSNRVTAILADVTSKSTFKKLGIFDHVMMNPPYYQTGRGQTPRTNHKILSHTDISGTIDQWITAANRFLKPKGTMTLIYPTEQLHMVLPLLTAYIGGITLLPLWPKTGRPSKRIIIQGIKGSKAPLTLLPGLTIHKDNNTYTPRADAVINNGSALIPKD